MDNLHNSVKKYIKEYTVRNLSPLSVLIPTNPFTLLQTISAIRFLVSFQRYFMYIQEKLYKYTLFLPFFTQMDIWFIHYLAYFFQATINLAVF